MSTNNDGTRLEAEARAAYEATPAEKPAKPFKAYTVSDGEDQSVIVYATNSATARRNGANEMNVDWEGVDTCRRSPSFDEYYPGPPPVLVLIDSGWWFECMHCGRKVHDGMHEDLEDEGEDSADYTITPFGKDWVYCSQSCCAEHAAERRAKVAAEAAFIELFECDFPGGKVESIYLESNNLTPPNPKYTHSSGSIIRFSFPGSIGWADYHFGSRGVALVQARDIDALLLAYPREPKNQAGLNT